MTNRKEAQRVGPKKRAAVIAAYSKVGSGSILDLARRFRLTQEEVKGVLADAGVPLKPPRFMFERRTPYGVPTPTWRRLKGRQDPLPAGAARVDVVHRKFLRVAKARIKLLREAGVHVNCSAMDAAQEAVLAWLDHASEGRGYAAMERMIERSCGPCDLPTQKSKDALRAVVQDAGFVISDHSPPPECSREHQRIKSLVSAKRVKRELSSQDRDVHDLMDLHDDLRMLSRMIDDLEQRAAKAIKLWYGLECEPHTYDEIGAMIGVSRERVRQIIAKGERRLSVAYERARRNDP